jgi:hypothetical protein
VVEEVTSKETVEDHLVHLDQDHIHQGVEVHHTTERDIIKEATVEVEATGSIDTLAAEAGVSVADHQASREVAQDLRDAVGQRAVDLAVTQEIRRVTLNHHLEVNHTTKVTSPLARLKIKINLKLRRMVQLIRRLLMVPRMLKRELDILMKLTNTKLIHKNIRYIIYIHIFLYTKF